MEGYHTIIGKSVSRAVKWLNSNETVALPTETVYGLAANALQADAVVRIYKAKKRPYFDPLIVHCSGIRQAESLCTAFPPLLRKLAEACWPGPLTLLVPASKIIPELVTSGLERVGLRVPDHPLFREVLERIDYPLAAPSANPFGYVSPVTARHVADQLAGKIPYILDGGRCRVGLESTIAGMEGAKLCIYRLGGLRLEILKEIAGDYTLKLNVNDNPQAPGMISKHYAPGKKILIGNIQKLWELHQSDRTAVISFGAPGIPVKSENLFILSPGKNTDEAAAQIFTALRYFDRPDVGTIIAELLPETGLGPAINDRLIRAAFHE